VVINSGRDKYTLDKWFAGLPVDLAAEHGTFYKDNNKWYQNLPSKLEWDEEIINIIQRTIEKTPGSHLEKKTPLLCGTTAA